MKMAGYYAAHALCGVASGEILVPIVGKLKTDQSRRMLRLAMGSVEAMAQGHHSLNTLEDDELGAVFIRDALVTLESGKTDCLLVDIRFAEDPAKVIQYLVPYRNARHQQGFAVHRLKINSFDGIDTQRIGDITEAFFDGREAHEYGALLWNTHYTEQAGVSADHQGEENTAFSGIEFEALKRAPFLVFFMVAAADGKIDKKELLAFIKLLTEAETYSNPLLTRIVTNIIDDIPAMATGLGQQCLDYQAELNRIRTIVENRMPAEQAEAFKQALFRVGRDIAQASGGFLGFGSRISRDEKRALSYIAACLGIDTQ
ncbi:MAG: hypothetical protein V4812_04675 [Pseudomonadota bacterium]